LIDRIRRRENPLHPLVTLGIARTVGYEVEYPETDRVRKLNRNGTFEFLERLGFKGSTAGGDCRETSPGPFYDPLTANLVFEKFADAKIVDLGKYEGMTMHFNVGLEESRGLVELVRAMYLTGAGYDPHVNFLRSGLCIRFNSNGFGQYVECKTFDVMEKSEFVWNMRCLSYLSWALGAHQYLARQGEESAWKKELAEIWKEYLGELNGGLKSVGLEGYLSEEGNGASSVQIVHQELERILPDTASRRKIEKRKGNLPPIRFDNREWPNVAAFTRRVTELSVRKIEALADKIEEEAIQDARVTEINHKYGRFLQKYDTPISSSSSNSRKQTFKEVRDLLLKNI